MLVFDQIQNRAEGLRRTTLPVVRASVPGGWLVCIVDTDASLCFVPDPEHRWDGSSIQEPKAAK